jgi:phenylalanine-4-hydroxylase
MLSAGGVARGKPFAGTALVALGSDRALSPGRFRLELPTGLSLEGFTPDGVEALDLRAGISGRPVAVPPWCLLVVARAVPSVAGGPGDPAAWDRWFGALGSFTEGDGEARARARKQAALSPDLAAAYSLVRRVREAGDVDRRRIDEAAARAGGVENEWLLREEVAELGRA